MTEPDPHPVDVVADDLDLDARERRRLYISLARVKPWSEESAHRAPRFVLGSLTRREWETDLTPGERLAEMARAFGLAIKSEREEADR